MGFFKSAQTMVAIADSSGFAYSGASNNIYRIFSSSTFYLYIVLIRRREAGAY